MGTSVSAIITVVTPALGVAPGVATGLTTSNITSTSIALTWVAPTTGTPPFSFQAQVSVSGSNVWTDFGALSSSLTATATGLTANTAYLFRVLTDNSTATSTSSTVGATTLSVAPGSPTGLAVVTTTATSIALQWVAPTTGTAPFTYQVSFRTPSGSGTFTPFTSTTTSLTQTITGLTAGSTYDFMVSASNAAGSGPASTPLVNVPTVSGSVVPSAPTNLAAGTITTNSIAVSWTASATGTPPVSYVLQYRPH